MPQHGSFNRLAETLSPVREKLLHWLNSTCWDATTTKRRLVQRQRRALSRRVGCAVAPRHRVQQQPTLQQGRFRLELVTR